MEGRAAGCAQYVLPGSRAALFRAAARERLLSASSAQKPASRLRARLCVPDAGRRAGRVRHLSLRFIWVGAAPSSPRRSINAVLGHVLRGCAAFAVTTLVALRARRAC